MKEPGRHLPGYSTGVTDSELERLTMAAEECAEVTQVITKIIRHGYGSYHPADPSRTPNRYSLRQEVIDVLAMATVLVKNGDIDPISEDEITKRIKAKKRYTHFQGPDTVW